MHTINIFSVAGNVLVLSAVAHAQRSLYQPCPLLGPFLPSPQIESGSPAVASLALSLDQLLDEYIAKADGRFGPTTPNTTSFSLALFAGSNYVAGSDKLPFFYEYHHTASELENESLDLNSPFPLGDLTQLFTVYAQLAELGDEVWGHSIVRYLPELENISTKATGSISQVQWSDVTLGALAGQMSGIARNSNICHIDGPCGRDPFLSALIEKLPVNLPDTTPIRSDAAFQLLALAVESVTKQPFSQTFKDRVSKPLCLKSTNFLESKPPVFGGGLSNTSREGEPAGLGLVSTISDLATLGHAMLTSEILPAVITRRWMKPFTSTSNLRNSVGTSWEIYHYGTLPTDPVVDIYTKTGTVGSYSSYFGLVPSHDVGFAILAVDQGPEAPDLNAYADITIGALLQIDKLARVQANATITGTYTAAGNDTLTIGPATAQPGLAIAKLVVNGTDWLAEIAHRANISPSTDLDFRLYPTDLKEGNQRAFRAVIQDMDALVDAGTPTCITWQQTVDFYQKGGLPLDEFVLEFGDDGVATAVKSAALGTVFGRRSNFDLSSR